MKNINSSVFATVKVYFNLFLLHVCFNSWESYAPTASNNHQLTDSFTLTNIIHHVGQDCIVFLLTCFYYAADHYIYLTDFTSCFTVLSLTTDVSEEANSRAMITSHSVLSEWSYFRYSCNDCDIMK